MKFKRITDTAILPTRHFSTDAGIDFYSDETLNIAGGEMRVVRTGIRIKIPDGTVGFVWPKGKSNHLIGAGVVDDKYTGELKVKVFNSSNFTLTIHAGDPICQLVIVPVIISDLEEVEEFEDTERAQTGGIHST